MHTLVRCCRCARVEAPTFRSIKRGERDKDGGAGQEREVGRDMHWLCVKYWRS